MIDLHLCDVLAILAESETLDAAALACIARAVPPGLHVPSPGDPKRQRMASGSPELAPQPQANAREAYLLQYRTLCEGGRG